MKTDFLFKNEDFNNFLINLVQDCIDLVNSKKNKWVKYKSDGSPITNIDLELDKLIYNSLTSLNLKIPIVSEEREHPLNIYQNTTYWLIDPLDGTRGYVEGTSEYTINIALIYKNHPVIGVIGHPPSKKIWFANKNNFLIRKDNKTKYKKFYRCCWCRTNIIYCRRDNDYDGCFNE